MHPPQTQSQTVRRVSRRQLLQAGLATGSSCTALGAETEPPRRGGVLRVRGYDPTHCDPHLTISFKTHTTLSFVYSKLGRYKVGTGVQPGMCTVEPDLAERWEQPDNTTYVCHLRQGVKWHNKPPLNGRALSSWWRRARLRDVGRKRY
jgi:peptide/nickel transport system substrate-binding protein